MNHSFNIEIASEYGIEEAIIIEHLFFWIQKNAANGKHFYNGRFWTYSSSKALCEIFPYMSRLKIHRLISSLVEKNLIMKGNYNKLKMDRTCWYAFSNDGEKLLNRLKMELPKQNNAEFKSEITIDQKGTNDCAKVNNREFKSEQPIPDIITDIITDIETDKELVAENKISAPCVAPPSSFKAFVPEEKFDLDLLREKCLTSPIWFENAQRALKKSGGEIFTLMNSFVSELKAGGRGGEKTEKDFKTHFINWAKLQKNGTNKQQTYEGKAEELARRIRTGESLLCKISDTDLPT